MSSSTASASTHRRAATPATELLTDPPPNLRDTRRPERMGDSKVYKICSGILYVITYALLTNVILLLFSMRLFSILSELSHNKAIAKSGDGVVSIKGDWEGKFAEMDLFIKNSSEMGQAEVDAIAWKLGRHVENVKGELERTEAGIDKNSEKQFGEGLERLLSKKEFEAFVGEYSKGKGKGGDGGVSLDDFMVYAREVVEKEIARHAADGLGRVDYALASGGSRVVGHSEAYITSRDRYLMFSSVHPDAEKMLTPSFGEPGKCFPLNGSSGYVTIRLRSAVVPEAVTLEHVEKSVAYDRSSAPKDCRISGWLAQAEDFTDVAAENEKMVLLSEFTYDLGKKNSQTFKVLDSVGSSIVDTIRFDITSNHGSLSHTCIYRLRVHGYEPGLSMLAADP